MLLQVLMLLMSSSFNKRNNIPGSQFSEYVHNFFFFFVKVNVIFNPLNAHAAKAKLTWQPVSCKQNLSYKILSMIGRQTLHLLSVLLTITGYKALYFKTSELGQPLLNSGRT